MGFAAVLLVGLVAGWALRRARDSSTPSAPPAAPRSTPAPLRPPRHHAEPVATPQDPPKEPSPPAPAAPGEVVGRVVLLPQRTPVAGALVELWTGTAAGVSPAGRRVATDADGVFRFARCKTGYYRAEAEVVGRGIRTASGAVTASSGADLGDLVFGDGGALEGRVLGERGPLGGATVFVCRGQIGGVRTSVVADDDGNYRFGDLAPGKYLVGVSRDATHERFGPFILVEAGRTVRCDFGGAVARLSGRVTLDGVPLRSGRVSVERADGIGTSNAVEAGEYRFGNLEPGDAKVRVHVQLEQTYMAPPQSVRLVSGDNALDLYVRSADLDALIPWSVMSARGPGGKAEIHGRVFARATGKPLVASEVGLALLVLDDDGRVAGQVAATMSEADGRFTFRHVHPGRRRIVATPRIGSLRGTSVDLNVAEGAKVQDIDVALDPLPTGKVVFHVKDEQGAPIVNVHFVDWTNVVEAPGVPINASSWGGTSTTGTFEWNYEVGRRVVRIWTTTTSPAGKVTLDRETRTTVDVREGETTDVEVLLPLKE